VPKGEGQVYQFMTPKDLETWPRSCAQCSIATPSTVCGMRGAEAGRQTAEGGDQRGGGWWRAAPPAARVFAISYRGAVVRSHAPAGVAVGAVDDQEGERQAVGRGARWARLGHAGAGEVHVVQHAAGEHGVVEVGTTLNTKNGDAVSAQRFATIDVYWRGIVMAWTTAGALPGTACPWCTPCARPPRRRPCTCGR
jgi:hypothetical protein